MEEHRDIYTKPTAKPEEPQPVVTLPEPAPGELRALTRRRIAYSLALMLLLLGVAAYYFYSEEQRLKRLEEKEEATPPPRRGIRTAMTSIPATPAEELAISLDQPPGQTPPDLPPQRLAEIMALLRDANRLMVNREWDAAEAKIRNALAVWPENNTALRMLGALYLQRGQFDQSILILERARRADPFNVDAFANLGIAYMQKGQFEQAEDLFLAAIELRPDIAVTHINLGLLYILWGKYEQAAEHLAIAVERLPDNAGARNNLGVALFRIGRTEEALQHFLKIIANTPERAETYFNAAVVYAVHRDYSQAFDMIRRGVSKCSPFEARRHLMDSDFDIIRELPEFQAIWRELSEPRPIAASPSS